MSAVIGPWIERPLRELLKQVGHAWLILGPSGLGQYELARALSKAWLCEDVTPNGACGVCPSCHTFESQTNPDLFNLMPEEFMLHHGYTLDEKVQKELDDKKRKPSREIKVDQARDLIEFSQMTRSGGIGKVALVYPAERMNTITANTILKTLEEPPEGFRFVLATQAAHELLPTIRSRCQSYTLSWPTREESLAWLTEQGLQESDALVWLKAAGGRPQNALDLAQHSGLSAKDWGKIPKSVASGEVSLLTQLQASEMVDVLQKLCHDMLALSVGAEGLFFDTQSLPKPGNFRALSDWSRDLMHSAQSADHPFNKGLMLETLVSQAKIAMAQAS